MKIQRLLKIKNDAVGTAWLAIVSWALLLFAGLGTKASFSQEIALSHAYRADIVWTQAQRMDHEIYYSRMRNGVWESKTQLSDNRAINLIPSLGRGPGETLWVVWSIQDGLGSHMMTCHFDGTTWSAPERLPSPLISSMSPSVAIDNDGVPWIVFAGFDGQDDDIFLTNWENSNWAAPQRIHTDNDVPDILPELEISDNGDLVVLWSTFNGSIYETRRAQRINSQWITGASRADQAMTAVAGRRDIKSVDSWLPDFIPDPRKANIIIETDEGLHPISLSGKHSSPTTAGASTAAPATDAAAFGANGGASLIIAFGDSITQGEPYVSVPGGGLPGLGGYEPHLETLFSNISQSVPVLNYGVAGEITANGINRMDSVLSANSANYILIMEGTNDYWSYSSETTKYNLGVLVDKSRAQGVEPVLATLTPDTWTPSKNIPTNYNPKIIALAGEKNVLLADQYAMCYPDWSTLSSDPGDGLHPNDDGYQVLVE